MRALRPMFNVAIWLLVLSCSRGGERTLRDSEGRTFKADCSAGPQSPCQLEQASGPQRAGMTQQSLLAAGRLVGICDVKQAGDPAQPYDCRPLSCDSDADCPPAHGMKDGQCLNRRCSDPAQAIAVSDSIMLCLAGTGLGRETPAQIERYALALNCGSPCRVPTPCQKPSAAAPLCVADGIAQDRLS